jgi:bacteriocin biosynthesis cyclodehydratase domain-containing protein
MRLLPGVRLVERPGALHFFDGRRVVSLSSGPGPQAAIKHALGLADSPGEQPRAAAAANEASELLRRLNLGANEAELDMGGQFEAAFASTVVAGQTSPHEAAERLRAVEVHVWDSPDAELQQSLAASGLRVRPLDDADRIARLDPRRSLVAVVADESRPNERLLRSNAACLAAGVRWLPVGSFDGALLRVGPLMVPGHTACAQCLLDRLAANVAYPELFADVAGAPSAPTVHALRSWAHSIATLVSLLWITTSHPDLPGRLYTLDPQTLGVRQSHVFAVPRCRSCAAPDFTTAAAPWSLSSDH